MPGLADLEARIEKLEQARDDIVEATRQAHAATKDLRAVIREAREILSSGPIVDRLDLAVVEGLDTYAAQIKKATDDATASVFKRYDDLAAILLDSKVKGISFADVAEELRTRNEARS